jgi:phosphohistidine swiveling domain-containing protein
MTQTRGRTGDRLAQAFDEIDSENECNAGGKGGVLVRLFKAGYPVPDGFIVLPNSFKEDDLRPEAWAQVEEQLARLRRKGEETSFAVRSSALSEDSARASFAGEFETVLDVSSDDEIRDAIHAVRSSRHSERVRVYSQIKGLDPDHEIAVIVQKLVRANISGVLFTADPVTGSSATMTGNFVHGLGDKLVSGESNAYGFTFKRPDGGYEGPEELSPVVESLYNLGISLEEAQGHPQDIEWAVADGELYLLQSRPITTLTGLDSYEEEWNHSLKVEYLWLNSGFGENLPGVMTPSTWSLWKIFIFDLEAWEVADAPPMGNICGRPYMNLSLIQSIVQKIYGKAKSRKLLEPMFGSLPEIDVPTVKVSYGAILTKMIPGEIKWQRKVKRLLKEVPSFISTTPGRCRGLRERILETDEKTGLIKLWDDDVKPLFIEAGYMLRAINEVYQEPWRKLASEVEKLVGKADADILMSTIGGTSQQLASLGLMVGVSNVADGEMSHEEYMERFGHRGQYEWHLSKQRPYEDPKWLEDQLEDYRRSPIDVESMLERRRGDYDEAWQRLQEGHPGKARSLKERMDKFASMSQEREEIRSELTRIVGVVRALFLRAGELTGLGDDAYFLTYQELKDVLSGDASPTEHIPDRKRTHAMYESLPPFPGVIKGHFDPVKWASDPNRRSDIYDAENPPPLTPASDTITGNPGSGGIVKGIVRRIDSPEEGHLLQQGEILVTTTTNVGWTPLFPRAAAVITDIGMPLAHAAIVARELGIPAVVGCGVATTRLRNGDLVLVDGGRGTVQILSRGITIES